MTTFNIAAAIAVVALAISNVLIWRKLMTTQTDTVLATLDRVDQVLTAAGNAGTNIATSLAAIQDAGAQIVAAANASLGSVPQSILDAVALIDQKAQAALADIEILKATPAEMDKVTSALLAGAKAINPVAPLEG